MLLNATPSSPIHNEDPDEVAFIDRDVASAGPVGSSFSVEEAELPWSWIALIFGVMVIGGKY